MAMMNKQLKLPQIQKIMAEFEKQVSILKLIYIQNIFMSGLVR